MNKPMRTGFAASLAFALLTAFAVPASALPDDGGAGGDAPPAGADAGLPAQASALRHPAAYSEQLLLKPVAVTAGSEAPGHEAANAANNSGMSGFFGPLETHGNDGDGAGMWRTGANPGADNWIQLDLGAVYPLGKMLVWNYNQPGEMDKGVKNARIQYSADGVAWTTLGGAGRTVHFKQASGTADEKASNWQAPIDFAGAPARYVRLAPDAKANIGNWGDSGTDGPSFGLSEIRIYRFSNPVGAGGQMIAVAQVSADSESEGSPALNAVNNLGMTGSTAKTDTHDRSGGWLSAADPAPGGGIQFDLGGTYPLGEMQVWNYNGPEGPLLGIQWAKVSFSLDGINWTGTNGGEPCRFARANGEESEAATNLEGSGNPVEFGGARARYVRIEPSAEADRPGSWGGSDGGDARYGLSQVRFYSASGIVVEPAPDWTSLFTRTEGWTGSDGIYSLAYDGYDATGKAKRTDTLFLFSDTFTGSVDPVTKARTLEGYYNNTLATLQGSAPDPANIRFLWGSDGTGRDFRSLFEPSTPYAYTGTVAANTVNEAAGMSPAAASASPADIAPPGPSDTHDNDKDGKTMWLTADDPGDDNWIKFDLSASYRLGKMPVWNYNQFDPDHPDIPYADRGLKNARIYYSNDDEHYTELEGPFQFAKATGDPKLAATNLVGGGVVDFGGAEARYVKIVPNAAPGDGNWGGTTGSEAMFGLSHVRFYDASGELLRYVSASAGSEKDAVPAGNWYWLQDGLSLNGQFYAFPLNMAPDPTQPPGWQFKVAGVSMVKLPNRNGPDLAHMTQIDTPLYYHTSIGGWPLSYTFGAGVMPNTAEAGAPDPDGYVYVYGYRDYAFEQLPTVARVKAEDFERFNEWRFWAGPDKGWTRNIEESAPLLSGASVSAEFSVTPMKGGPFDGKYLLVFEKDTLSHYMTYSVGDSPTGPFGALFRSTTRRKPRWAQASPPTTPKRIRTCRTPGNC